MSGSAAAKPVRSTWNKNPLTLAAKSANQADRDAAPPSGTVGSPEEVFLRLSAMAILWPTDGLAANEVFSKRHESVSCRSQSWFLAAMVRHLPPFAPLVAFDAVARHRSFTRAA